MKRVYISIGSNIERYRHVSAALDALAGWFGELAISPVYESESVGFDGSDFLNLVVGVDTNMSVGELSRRFKKTRGRQRPQSFGAQVQSKDSGSGYSHLGRCDRHP